MGLHRRHIAVSESQKLHKDLQVARHNFSSIMTIVQGKPHCDVSTKAPFDNQIIRVIQETVAELITQRVPGEGKETAVTVEHEIVTSRKRQSKSSRAQRKLKDIKHQMKHYGNCPEEFTTLAFL